MPKLYLGIILLLLFSNNCYCQQSADDKKLLDSMIKSDDLLSMLDNIDKPFSYVRLNAGITNKLFSVNNNSLNAMQQNKKLIFSPSVEYYNKTGLGISFAAFFINDNNKYDIILL